MASTALGAQLTQLHYRQQTAIRAQALRDMLRIWPAFDTSSIDAVDATWAPVEEALVTLTKARATTSAGTAANYYRLFRTAEGASGAATPHIAIPATDQIVTSLRVTGPFTAKHLLAINNPKATDNTLARLSGSFSRLVGNGGRDTLGSSIRADRQAVGYARVTSGNPCYFCALLAGRGAVFKADTVDFQAHDHCSCMSEPVYRPGAALPGRGDEFRQLYREATADAAPGEQIQAFRKAFADA